MKTTWLTAVLAGLAFNAAAADAIYIGGVKYSYQLADFTPISKTALIDGKTVTYTAGYRKTLEVFVDEYDADYGAYPGLIFDLRAEVAAAVTTEPLKVSYDVSCSREPVGADMDLIFQKRGRVTPARLSVYERKQTNGRCQSLDVVIMQAGTDSQNAATPIQSIKLDAMIALELN